MIRRYHLGRSIWEVSVENEDSWGWKNLLSIRDLIKPNVIYKIGNGVNTSLWFDNWSNIGPLFQYITHKDLYDERLNADLKVRDMIGNGDWLWPRDWLVRFPVITNLEVPKIDEQTVDKIIWRTNNGKDVEFSVKQVNFDLSSHGPIEMVEIGLVLSVYPKAIFHPVAGHSR
ncbi:hypothetical protein Tco_0527252 [Tanacetum coccineum]